MSNNNTKSIFQEVTEKIKGIANNFWKWLKPDPFDHWSVQILKSLAKVPLVVLLVLFSPILIVVLLIIFLIAI